MKVTDYNVMIMDSFWKNCRPHWPQTATKVRRVLIRVAGEIVSPKVAPEDFSDEDCRRILVALKNRNRDRVRPMVLEAMRKVREKK